MSFLYDSKRRRVQPWIPVLFLLLPVVILAISYYLTKENVQNFKAQKDKKQQEDVFESY